VVDRHAAGIDGADIVTLRGEAGPEVVAVALFVVCDQYAHVGYSVF
jgi:hypothetical protein